MHTIWKYELAIIDEQTIEMPAGAVILTVQVQDGKLCLWAKVNTVHLVKTKRKIAVVGTGNSFDGIGAYIGTAQLGPGVWHVFEK